MVRELVSDELWAVVEPLLPPEPPKPKGDSRAPRPPDADRHPLLRARVERALEEETIRSLSKDSPEVVQAVRRAAPILVPRPRDHKRFVNAVRLQMVAGMRLTPLVKEGEDGKRELALADHLAKWTALCMRWPLLVQEVRNDDCLLDALQDWADGNRFGGRQPDEPVRALMQKPGFAEAIRVLPSLKGVDVQSMLMVH